MADRFTLDNHSYPSKDPDDPIRNDWVITDHEAEGKPQYAHFGGYDSWSWARNCCDRLNRGEDDRDEGYSWSRIHTGPTDD